MITSGTWHYNAAKGEVTATDGDSIVRVAVLCVDDDFDACEAEETDANGELVAVAPLLLVLARDLAEGGCKETKDQADPCGECLPCRARDLADEVPS